MYFDVTILGNSSATPTPYRHPSSQLLRIHEKHFLIDCGEGTQIQLIRFKQRLHKINHIFISHLHGDHYLGLFGLLSTLHLQLRAQKLHIYGPPELAELFEVHFRVSDLQLRYELELHPTDPTTKALIYEDEFVFVHSFPLSHRIPCTGFVFTEKSKPRKLNKVEIDKHQVPPYAYQTLKNGRDFTDTNGNIYKNEDYTTEPDLPRSYAYCSDTIYDPTIIPYIKDVNLLYHEATFLHEHAERAQLTFHTTAQQAGNIAKSANAKQLLLGHFSARYKELDEHQKEAAAVFPNTQLALEGNTYIINGAKHQD